MGKKSENSKPAAAPAPATKAAAPKKKAAAKKPASKAKKAAVAKVIAAKTVITTEDIALRAYFIAEKRQKAGLPGDAHQDWVEAERQLFAEGKKRPAAK